MNLKILQDLPLQVDTVQPKFSYNLIPDTFKIPDNNICDTFKKVRNSCVALKSIQKYPCLHTKMP